MSEDKLQIKLTKSKPHKVYSTNLSVDAHIKQLCKFLRKYKGKRLEILINNKKMMFNSAIEREKFATGFELSFKIVERCVERYVDKTNEQINELKSKLADARVFYFLTQNT